MDRRKITANDRSLTGSLISSKMGSSVDFESSLERDYFIILEFDQSVDSYIEQPIEIQYKCAGGINRFYTPDVLVTFKDPERKPWLCEIKYRSDFRENFSTYKPKFKAAKKYCQEKGWEFVLIDESIRGDFLANAKFLLKYKNRDYVPEVKHDVIKVLIDLSKENGFFTPMKFRENFGQTFEVKATGLAEFWRLVMRGEILFDYDIKLSMSTEMWLNDTIHGEH